MLNYIWAALILLGLAAAIISDVSDEVTNKYSNGKYYNCKIFDSQKHNSKILFYGEKSHYGNKTFNSRLVFIDSLNYKTSLLIDKDVNETLKEIAQVAGEKNEINGKIEILAVNDSVLTGRFLADNVSLVKIKSITDALIDYAGIAVKIAIGLIGIMALWLGVMKIAEEAGIVKIISRLVKPVTKFLFPEVPHNHPAIGAIIMNMSANMLGLGNAATPFGLKAMEELNKLNTKKDTATNAMCTFLAVNTAGLTLIPATAIAVRASSGSSNPAIIIATSIFGAFCATTAGIFSAKLFEKFSGKRNFLEVFKDNRKIFTFIFSVMLVILTLAGIWSDSIISFLNKIFESGLIRQIITTVSALAIPVIVAGFVLAGLIKKIKIYEVFVEGAKEGFNVAVRIIPFLVAMLVAIAIFRAGGGMEILITALTPFSDLIGMPSEALPMALMRPLSGSGSLGIMTETINQFGPDSFIGVLTSTFFGSTETTFYVLAVYFGAVNIKKTRHALPVGLLADVAGIMGALFIVKQLFG